MALKTQYLYYTARNFATGLTDVRAQLVDRNGSQVATDLLLAEVDATNAPGLYALPISPATLTTWGGAGTYVAYINSDSANQNAPAVVKFVVTENDTDDLSLQLASVDTKIDTLQTSVNTLQTDVTSIKTTVESTNGVVTDPTDGNANIRALVESAINSISSIQNNTRFIAVIPSDLISLESGSGNNRYRIPIRIFDTSGNLEDPDTNQVQVSIQNESGVDRTNYIVGFTAGPVDATRDSEGVYRVDIDIPDTAPLEQLIFVFQYSEATIALNHVRTSQVVKEAQATGLALQATLLDVLTDTADMQPRVQDIQTKINDPVTGLANIKALIDVIDGVVDSNNAELTNATYGLSALKTILDTKASQVSIDAITTILNSDVKGAGFTAGTDSLTQISSRIFFGGQAV